MRPLATPRKCSGLVVHFAGHTSSRRFTTCVAHLVPLPKVPVRQVPEMRSTLSHSRSLANDFGTSFGGLRKTILTSSPTISQARTGLNQLPLRISVPRCWLSAQYCSLFSICLQHVLSEGVDGKATTRTRTL